MRQYIRHPSDIPINYELDNKISDQTEFLKNISEGGLCFQSKSYIEISAVIIIHIPIRTPPFEEKGMVLWCSQSDEMYDVGVQFKDISSEFRVRMIEQICQIEHYKNEILRIKGRKLTGKEAASEWIAKYAKDFPT